MGKREINILFLTPVPEEGAGCRFRIKQYLPYLKSEGMHSQISPFFFGNFFKIVYRPGRLLLKISYFLIAVWHRFYELLRIQRYDIIFIYREAFPFGPPLYEYLVYLSGRPIIFDFDDAIYLPNFSKNNKWSRFFKCPSRVIPIIKWSNKVIAGNRYLESFAIKHNPRVIILPTVIDTDVYSPASSIDRHNYIVIGWMGTPTTGEYLKDLSSVFTKILAKYSNVLIEIVGFEFREFDNSRLINKEWSLATEVEDLRSFDIGIMPLPYNEWANGKCGFKAILYMSVGKPCVCSAVGVNKEIIIDGFNGFLATTEQEWLDRLSLLIERSELRTNIAAAARETVEERYSLKNKSTKFLKVVREAAMPMVG